METDGEASAGCRGGGAGGGVAGRPQERTAKEARRAASGRGPSFGPGGRRAEREGKGAGGLTDTNMDQSAGLGQRGGGASRWPPWNAPGSMARSAPARRACSQAVDAQLGGFKVSGSR